MAGTMSARVAVSTARRFGHTWATTIYCEGVNRDIQWAYEGSRTFTLATRISLFGPLVFFDCLGLLVDLVLQASYQAA